MKTTTTPRRKMLLEWGLRLAGLAAIGAAIAIWRPGIIGGFHNSLRAIGLVVLGLAALVAIEWWLRRKGRPGLGRATFYTLVVVGVLAAVIPSFISKTVHEEESDLFADAKPAMMNDQGTATPSPSAPPAPATGPVELGQADLDGIDHRASGLVRVAQDAEGQLAVRFEDLDVEPGPDYYIWLVPGSDQEDPGDGVNLGRIKANKGDQEFQAPDDFRADKPLTVLIWCRAFAVPIGNATIA